MAVVVLLAVSIPGLCLLWWFSHTSTRDKSRCYSKIDEPAICQRILACTSYDDSGAQNRLGPLQSRACPNQRLVRAFEIDNAFTTTDEKYRTAFRTDAKERITKLGDADWKLIADLAQQLVRKGILQPSSCVARCFLDSLVQSVSLKISLHVLFGLSPLELEDEIISEIASSIDLLWRESKHSHIPAKADKSRLTSALARIFPQIGPCPQDNPLNLILPAYETLWRVVLFCFIEVTFRKGRQAESLSSRTALGRFVVDPTKARFEELASPNDGVSVAHIANEALRLYPPTRRIHRAFLISGSPKIEFVAADIEQCHRSFTIWGSDSYIFRPSRWRTISDEAHNAFMPFGGRPFLCPAKLDFGPRMIGVLVAALAAQISPLEWKFDFCVGGPDGGEGLKGDEPFLSDRGAYEWMEIARRSP